MKNPVGKPSGVTSGLRRNTVRLEEIGIRVFVFSRRERVGVDYQFVTSTYARVVHPTLGEVLPAATESELEAFVTGVFLVAPRQGSLL